MSCRFCELIEGFGVYLTREQIREMFNVESRNQVNDVDKNYKIIKGSDYGNSYGLVLSSMDPEFVVINYPKFKEKLKANGIDKKIQHICEVTGQRDNDY